ncbi:carboxypeptidase regulatory-like domain-containing protein [Alteromonas lipolytica]|uniref:TonB-dependent receptor n=1 Tax=Alteromonas lipolytica TaxID=1856405 RepID=A0A1E8FHU8_9ALTE|nr:carboxypeptidase regulatory-like domain-containing protein [Alteromonas lipolytica]OFI35510.1 TonB-dependent receptor [Alteromonas lipolytica]GGF76844.1 hypothetical protein GCM10011338_31330 [Alteromonas lipolytica]
MHKELTSFKARLAGQYLRHAIRQTWNNRPSSTAAVMFAGAMAAGICAPVQAQQITGSIKGTVTAPAADVAVSGVEVVVTSDVMPKPRSTTTRPDGTFTLPYLLPGDYDITFTFSDGSVRKLTTKVFLDQAAVINFVYQPADMEVIEIVGSPIVMEGDSALSNSFGEELVANMPIGQTYRDMLKILPGVAYSEANTLGPSAGGSGVDNSYGFDGVDLSLPLFGNLASEPSTHDIANVSIDRGAAKAIGFNRSGGFAVNVTSKSGTNDFHGSLEYRLQNSDFAATPKSGVIQDTDRSWIIGSVSGPIIEDELFFYASYYRPEEDGSDKFTRYGPAKPYSSERDEYFGKLTWAPTDDILLNISQRYSERENRGESIGEFEADSVSLGSETKQDILSIDGSWLLGDVSSLTFKYGKYVNEGSSRPDNELSFAPVIGESLDINNLTGMGYFSVPELRDLIDDEFSEAQIAAYNANVQGLINLYGYDEDGVLTGGGGVGVYSNRSDSTFERESFEVGFDTELYTGDITHILHFGFQWSEVLEELSRVSNGWGGISYIGGLNADAGEGQLGGAFYRATVYQMGLGGDVPEIPNLRSYAETLNFEINDEIEWDDFTFNVGFLISRDTLYGQGLRKNSSTVSGYEIAVGNKYEMYQTDWKDMVQPRLGVTWEYAEAATVFANYASYNPSASSLARAASWDRRIADRTLQVFFDENGDYLTNTTAAGSAGKFFAENMRPRRIDEITLGATKALTNDFFLRSHLRYRYGSHFWEDMPNAARSSGTYGNGAVPDSIAARGDYIDGVREMYDQLGNVSSYVIAEVDNGQTKYWEWSIEGEYRADSVYVNASYVWSHYYGNFDQDNTTTTNDNNVFIGSSNYGDGNGRYSWDNRYGKLIGDKPHKVKVLATYTADWDGIFGAYFIFQSGEAWTAWDGGYYGYASSTTRFAEPAGSRRGASHWQMDLSYTQNWEFMEGYTARFRADVFNVFDKQTGYNYNPFATSDLFGTPRNYYNPRRIQLAVGVKF